MKYQPFVFWAIALIIGILLQYYFEFKTNIFWVIGGVSVLILLIFRTLNVAKKFFPWVGIILVIVLGAHRFQQKNNLTQINVEILEKPQLFHLEID